MQTIQETLEDATGGAVKASALRRVPGTCPKHGETTALLHHRFGPQEWFCGECALEEAGAEQEERWKRERKQTLDTAACIPERYIGQRFVATSDKQKNVRITVKAFRDGLTREGAWAVLMLIGETGTGKTLLACELAQVLINTMLMSVRYCTAMQMISEIQAAYKSEGKTEESEILRFTQYDLLMLDEIDAIRTTENASLLLTEVINRRYNAQRPVVVISNQPMEKLAKFVGDRVFSRLQENMLLCAHDWPDQRRGA